MPYDISESARAETKIKILRGVSIFCQAIGCSREATHIFRTGTGPIAAYCELHSEVEADRIGLDLPMDKDRLLYRFVRRPPQSESEAPNNRRRGLPIRRR